MPRMDSQSEIPCVGETGHKAVSVRVDRENSGSVSASPPLLAVKPEETRIDKRWPCPEAVLSFETKPLSCWPAAHGSLKGVDIGKISAALLSRSHKRCRNYPLLCQASLLPSVSEEVSKLGPRPSAAGLSLVTNASIRN